MKLTCMKENSDYGITKSGNVYSHKTGKWKLLKPQTDTDGYLQVRLFNNGNSRLTFVHRIVAETFLSNPDGLPEVNHVDGNKRNNDVRNLKWCTRQENMLHAHDTGLAKTRTPIVATNIRTGERLTFKGQRDAARILGVNQGNMNHALKRKNGSSMGYRFEYAKGSDLDD